MRKAQTSMEVLLLLGGAILVATIIGIALKNMGTFAGNAAVNAANCTALPCNECIKTTGCAGYDGTGTKIFDAGAAVSCTVAQQTAFNTGGTCKGT